MPAPGERAQLLTMLDNMRAENELLPMYSVELSLALAPKTKKVAGAIVVFKQRVETIDERAALRPEEINELMAEAAKSTQTMHTDPEFFAEHVNNRGLAWAYDRMLTLFDRYGRDVSFAICCSALNIHERVSRKQILAKRDNPRQLFRTAKRIEDLLCRGFVFDPWGGVIRRGRIGPRLS